MFSSIYQFLIEHFSLCGKYLSCLTLNLEPYIPTPFFFLFPCSIMYHTLSSSTELLASFFLAIISGGITLIQHLSSGEVTVINTHFKGVIWTISFKYIFKEKVRLVEKKTSHGNVRIEMSVCLLMFHNINALSSWLTRLLSEDVKDPSVPTPVTSEEGCWSWDPFFQMNALLWIIDSCRTGLQWPGDSGNSFFETVDYFLSFFYHFLSKTEAKFNHFLWFCL